MRKVLAVVLFLVGFSNIAFANHVNGPEGVPGKDSLAAISETLPCGKLTIASDLRENGWALFFLNDAKNPFLIVKLFAFNIVKMWVDNNQDGHIDELYVDENTFYTKYPNECSVVK